MDIDSTPGPRPTAGPNATAPISAVLARAWALSIATNQGSRTVPLKGKNIGLLVCSDEPDDATLFSAAATDLGAHVARVKANLSDASSPAEIADTARILGRLYDAVECQGLPERVVKLLSKEAGIPVFDGIACAQHPSAALVDSLDATLPVQQRRRLVIQALLLDAAW